MKKRETKAVQFPEAKTFLRGGSTGAADLPIFTDGQQVVSCWQIPFLKRFKVLLTGRVWLCVRGTTHAPLWLDTEVFERRTFGDYIRMRVSVWRSKRQRRASKAKRAEAIIPLYQKGVVHFPVPIERIIIGIDPAGKEDDSVIVCTSS